MAWYEHLFGILAMIFCFVGIPFAVLIYSCVVVGADADEDKHYTNDKSR